LFLREVLIEREKRMNYALIAAIVLTCIATVLIFAVYARNRALRKLIAYCCKLADGDVDFEGAYRNRADIVAAIRALETVGGRLVWFRDEFERLRRRSSCADIGARMKEEQFPGIYHSIVNRANAYIGSITAYLDVLGEPAFSVDLEYNLIYMNKDACDLLGMAPDQILGRKCFDHFKCDKCRTEDCICTRAIREKGLVRGEASSVFNGCEMFFNQTGVAIMDYEDDYKITAGLEILSDVTEIYKLKRDADDRAGRTRDGIDIAGGTIADMTHITVRNVENADKASKLSETAKQDALAGSRSMTEMLTAMEEIKNASSGIANIIKSIEDIAFQTNILALNAAVEAARAGEHGKGFAVVADEVRNLAARSADSAKETTVLIDNTVNKVQRGVQIANETASALEKIVTGISNAEAIVSEIAAESKNQESVILRIKEQIEYIGVG